MQKLFVKINSNLIIDSPNFSFIGKSKIDGYPIYILRIYTEDEFLRIKRIFKINKFTNNEHKNNFKEIPEYNFDLINVIKKNGIKNSKIELISKIDYHLPLIH